MLRRPQQFLPFPGALSPYLPTWLLLQPFHSFPKSSLRDDCTSGPTPCAAAADAFLVPFFWFLDLCSPHCPLRQACLFQLIAESTESTDARPLCPLTGPSGSLCIDDIALSAMSPFLALDLLHKTSNSTLGENNLPHSSQPLSSSCGLSSDRGPLLLGSSQKSRVTSLMFSLHHGSYLGPYALNT